MAKVIRNLNIDLSDMAAAGGNRSFSVEGDAGAIFSLEVINEDGYYYNFDNTTFASHQKGDRLKQKAIGGNGKYNGSITFPIITDDDQYDIYLWAEPAYDTVHAKHKEVRFGDDSIDLNSSTGSNSNLLQKVIYQYTDTTITLTPAFEASASVSWYTSAVSDTITIGRGKNSGKQAFTMTVLAPAAKAIQILRQPIANDWFFQKGITRLDTLKLIEGEDIWATARALSSGVVDGHTRGNSTTNGTFSGVTKIIVDALPTGTAVGDRLTGFINIATDEANSLLGGASAPDTTLVLITAIDPDGDNANEFTVDTSLTIADGHTLYFNAPYYFRFGTRTNHADGNIIGLFSGLQESLHLTTPSIIAPYESAITYTTEILNNDGSITEQTTKAINVSVPAIDTTGFKPTIVNGKVTKQDGLVCFDPAVIADRATTETFKFYLRGPESIKARFSTDVKFTDLKVELTAPTTTTTSAVSGSTSIPVADREGVIHSVSTISGIGIDSSAADPTIASGGEADGAGTWVASAAQTLESGITLTVGGTSRNVTITGNIEVSNCDNTDFTLYIDIFKFLTGT